MGGAGTDGCVPWCSRMGGGGTTRGWRARAASYGMNSWTGRFRVLSGRYRLSRGCGARSTTMSALTVPSAIVHWLKRPSSTHPPLLQPWSVSHNLWYNYWGQVLSMSSDCVRLSGQGKCPSRLLSYHRTVIRGTCPWCALWAGSWLRRTCGPCSCGCPTPWRLPEWRGHEA